ncbi:MAG: hypothetical protein HMLIMOIP_001457 [Candidatus Nitrosomirales archaeon]|jgi:hypothetical protein
MSDLEELAALLNQKAEINLALIVSANEIHLNSKNQQNRIYVLEVDAGGHAAGGRGGGFGQRKFKKVYGFEYENGSCSKFLETGENLEDLDSGYVVRLPITLPDGKEIMASCSVDSQLVQEYNRKFNR